MFGKESFRCWNHILTNIDVWVKKHAGRRLDCTIYKSQVKELFHLATKIEYEQELETRKLLWDITFTEYYTDNIGCNIDKIARWALEKVQLYDPYSGITTNYSEGTNNLLHMVSDYKELPLDVCVLVFDQLSVSFWNEIMKGFALDGNYSLKQKYLRYKTKSDEVILRKCVGASQVAEYINQLIDDNNRSGQFIPTQPDPSDSQPNHSDLQPDHSDPSGSKGEQEIKSQKKIAAPSQEVRARMLVESGNVVLIPQLKVFNVKSENGTVYLVSLNPKESCTCPQGRDTKSLGGAVVCYHIIAAKLSIGIIEPPKIKVVQNLTQLRGKFKNGLKDGRKYRKNDEEKVGIIFNFS